MPKRIIVNGVSQYPPVEISKFERTYPAAQKVVATGIPTQYARAGILAKAQKLETEKTFASLIRID